LTSDCRSYRDEPISLRIESPVPPVTKPGEFVRWLQNRLLEIEIHERDEWLRLDGKLIVDPHASDVNIV